MVRVVHSYYLDETQIFDGLERDFKDAISEFAEDLIDHAGHGYEEDEGGYGEVTIVAPDDDNPEGLITVDHNDRIITTKNTVSTF